ncbi:MAG: DUF6291 domain-containing protein [Ruminococcus flavefaciens]|nr:DUF6291 domain-containing protein [Ruminococcus flavefaciens]
MSPQKRPPGVMLYYAKIRPILALLNDTERGRLLMAILDYGESCFPPVLDDRLADVWPFVQEMIDKDIDAYQRKCDKAAKAIQARWAKERAKNEGGETG